MTSFTLIVGDMLARLRELPDNSIDSVVSDPPYHLTSIVQRFGADGAAPAKVGATGAYARASKGFMGQTWDGGDIAFRPETWAEVLRVLKPGGHIVAFSGTRTYHRMAVAIEDAGFEVRDMISWAYGSGFPKSHNVERSVAVDTCRLGGRHFKQSLPKDVKEGDHICPKTEDSELWDGWGTALKPSLEPICLARKPLSEKSIAANVLKWGTGALNIDGCRIEAAADYHDLDVTQGGDHFSIGSDAKTRGTKFQPAQGRWPANLCHDGSDEVLAGFPDDTGANGGTGEFRQHAWMGGDTPQNIERSKGSAARFFYSAKASKLDRLGTSHPTVKPVNLKRWLVRMVTPPGGTVLDPFAGSGTTAVAAFVEGFDSVMVELRQEAADDIQRRMDHIRGLGRLTALEKTHLDPEGRLKASGDGLPLFERR